jgi:phosphoglycerate dehydrogenase-like enzyme
MVKAAFFCNNPDLVQFVYAQGRKEKLEAGTRMYPEMISSQNFEQHVENLQDLEVVFSTWGMPELSEAQLERLPGLKAVFYGAGSVQGFARPLLKRNITLMSAWGANAVPVAEFTLAQILLASKGYYRNIRDSKCPDIRKSGEPFRGRGNYGETVALLGAGMIGRKVIELLRNFHLQVIVHDPFLSDEAAGSLGVEKVSLEAAFERGYVVSNHVPDLPATKNMLGGKLFERMRENAVFINTARGATVVEGELLAVLKQRHDLTALLDVTCPEPPEESSEFYTLPNIYLTSHIAGSLGDEVVRMADFCIEEFERWKKGEPLKYAVTQSMLETMA